MSDYVSVHEGVLREILRSLAGIDLDLPPPLIGQRMHRNLREIMGNEDPYREVKRRHNHLALSLLPELKQMVRNSPDPLKTSVLLAISGNVIDLGTNSGLTVSRAKVIPHPRGRGNSPLLPEMVVCYCRVLGLNFFL